MQLTVNGSPQTFIPIRQFRAQYHLPEDFGVRLFEPKDYTGLAALDHAGEALNALRTRIIAALPDSIKLTEALFLLDDLQNSFEAELRVINAQVGLREPEIEFAVAGFGDMLRAWLYALLRGQAAKASPPDFQTIYDEWVQQSIRISSTRYDYTHQNQVWQIQIVNHVYGRVGLMVEMANETVYIQDMRDACPAEGYMANLLCDVTQTLLKRLDV